MTSFALPNNAVRDFPLLPVSVVEVPGSRMSSRGTNPADEYRFLLTGFTDEWPARVFLQACVPLSLGSEPMWLQSVDVQERKGTFGIWDGSAKYGPVKLPDAGDWTWDFDCTPENVHVTHGKEHIADYAPSGMTAPNHQGAIGVTQDGSIEGVDWYAPKFEWTEKHVLAYTGIADAWALATNLATFAGCLNDATFRGFAAGQVLFIGGSGGRSTTRPGLFDLTVRFRGGFDVTGLTVGSGASEITGIAKKAWEYLWIESGPKADSAAGMLQVPKAAHVERMGDWVDFSELGINMGPPTY